MVAVTSDLFVGSYENLPAQSFQAELTSGGGPQNATLSTGDYYLVNATANRSLLDAVASEIENAIGEPPTIALQRDLRVQIAFSNAASITWGSATTLRNLLGFTGDLSSNTLHTATNISPLIWSAGYRALTRAHGDAASGGEVIVDTIQTKSNTGRTINTITHGQSIIQDFSWDFVYVSRVQTSSELGGEFITFVANVLNRGQRFTWHKGIVEDPSSTTLLSLTTAVGPYKSRSIINNWYNRAKQPAADIGSNIRIEAVIVDEYS